jgi:hypothetical protein
MPRREMKNITNEVTIGPPPWLKVKIEETTLIAETSGMKISDIKD